MAAFNCGKTNKVFSGTGVSVGPSILKPFNPFEIASQTARDKCLQKCNDWISSKPCKNSCHKKTSSIVFVSSTVSVTSAGAGKIRVSVTTKMKAVVRCSK